MHGDGRYLSLRVYHYIIYCGFYFNQMECGHNLKYILVNVIISNLDGYTLIGHPVQKVVMEDIGKEMFHAYE